MRWETTDRLVRVVLASIVFTLFMTWSFFAAVMTGWSVTEPGLARLWNSAPGLLGSAFLGVIAVGWCRLLMGWRPLSRWLLLALPMPIVFALGLLGFW